jgi:hypothetical protein
VEINNGDNESCVTIGKDLKNILYNT